MAKAPKPPSPVGLGPWQGLDTVDDATGGPFQPRERPDDPAPFLREAVNVDLDRLGWPRRRTGRTKRLALSNAHALASVGGRLLVADSGALLAVEPRDWSTRVIASGLQPGAPVSFTEAGGEVFWTDGVRLGRIGADGAALTWGLEPPTLPMVSSAGGGTLRAGRYLVAVTCETLDGLESGARGTVPVAVADGATLVLSGFSVEPAGALINVYVSDCDGRVPFFVDAVPVGALPIAVPQVGLTTDALDGVGWYSPMPGSRTALYRGRLLVARDAVLQWSQPLAFHHFARATDIQMFDGRILLLEALDDGFYVSTPTAVYWIAGDDPENWQPRTVDTRAAAEGPALRVPGQALPGLGYDGPVLVWASADGFVAGLPGGRIVHLSAGKVAMDAHAHATLAYRESPGLRQILLGLREQGASSRLASSDRVSCRVIKAGAIEE